MGVEIGDLASQTGKGFAVRVGDRTRNQLIRAYGRGADLAAYETTGKQGPVVLGTSSIARRDGLIKEAIGPIAEWNEELGKKLGDEIRRTAITNDMSPGEVAAHIRGWLPKAGLLDQKVTIHRPGKRPYTTTQKSYTEMIARTIPSKLRNDAYASQAETMDVYKGWTWVALGDERQCKVCGAKHGRLFKFGDPTPPAHPNCRCRILLEPKDDIDGETDSARPTSEEVARVRALQEDIDADTADIALIEAEVNRILSQYDPGAPDAGETAAELDRLRKKRAKLVEGRARRQNDMYLVKSRHASFKSGEEIVKDPNGNEIINLKGLGLDDANDVAAVSKSFMNDYPEYMADRFGAIITCNQLRSSISSRDGGPGENSPQAKLWKAKYDESCKDGGRGVTRIDIDGKNAIIINPVAYKSTSDLERRRRLVEMGDLVPGGDVPVSVMEEHYAKMVASDLGLTDPSSPIYKKWDVMGVEDIETQLSKYGSTSVDEFISQAWVEYRLSSEPRPLASEVGQYLEAALQQYELENKGKVRPA
jgi:SPP1 gp7 family putative phage head morphogenesis protein